MMRLVFSRRAGSSPRRRGTRYRTKWASARPRFIPAQAGNTLSLEELTMPVPVHPRAGGEHASSLRNRNGSSPRRRSSLVPMSASRHRFIPAQAGNTLLVTD